MTTYEKLAEESEKLGEDNDCTVKALALIADLDYWDAWCILEENGREFGDAVECDSWNAAFSGYNDTFNKIIEDQGYELFRCSKWPAKTLKTFDKVKSKEVFLLYTGKPQGFLDHVCVYKNGRLECWARGKRLSIKSVWMVRKK